jgi:uncharacterized coiled-coil protein SlyX
MAKDPQDRIRELERHCEPLENAIQEIRTAMYEPKVTLPQAKHRVAHALMKLRRLQKRDGS